MEGLTEDEKKALRGSKFAPLPSRPNQIRSLSRFLYLYLHGLCTYTRQNSRCIRLITSVHTLFLVVFVKFIDGILTLWILFVDAYVIRVFLRCT